MRSTIYASAAIFIFLAYAWSDWVGVAVNIFIFVIFWLWYTQVTSLTVRTLTRFKDPGTGLLLILLGWLLTSVIHSPSVVFREGNSLLGIVRLGSSYDIVILAPFLEEIWRAVTLSAWVIFPKEAIFLSSGLHALSHSKLLFIEDSFIIMNMFILSSLIATTLMLRNGFWAAFLFHVLGNSYRPALNIQSMLSDTLVHLIYWIVSVYLILLFARMAYGAYKDYVQEVSHLIPDLLRRHM